MRYVDVKHPVYFKSHGIFCLIGKIFLYDASYVFMHFRKKCPDIKYLPKININHQLRYDFKESKEKKSITFVMHMQRDAILSTHTHRDTTQVYYIHV